MYGVELSKYRSYRDMYLRKIYNCLSIITAIYNSKLSHACLHNLDFFPGHTLAHTCTCMHTPTHVWPHNPTLTHTCTYMHTHTCTCVGTPTHVYVPTCTQTHPHPHPTPPHPTHMCTHIKLILSPLSSIWFASLMFTPMVLFT